MNGRGKEKMGIDFADRINKLPPYLFEEIDKAKNKARKENRPVIDLGVGDPDIPTPEVVVEELRRACRDAATHKYALNKGLSELRQEMASWYEERFDVKLDPETEILPLMGSKDGIAHIPLAFAGSGDAVLMPDPGYPPYHSGTLFAGAEPVKMPLLAENDFLPDLEAIPGDILKRARLMHLNYPNNPTGATCGKEFYDKVVELARRNDIIVCSDAAYTEISFDGHKPVSFLESEGAKDVGIEFHSLSKSFNMTGWRVGMAVGNSRVLQGLAKIKANVDSGIFTAVQWAAIAALKNSREIVEKNNKVYQARRDALVGGLRKAGWQVYDPLATFYVWAPVLEGYDSSTLAKTLLEKTDIVVTPGVGFGAAGEGYIRMALTVDKAILEEAVGRITGEFFG